MKRVKKIVLEYSFIFIGSLILALGINFFLLPVKLSTGGISGIGTVLYYVAGIPISVTVFCVNILLFFAGYKTLPKSSLVKTLFGILFLSLFLELLKINTPIVEDLFLTSVFGGAVAGIGVGLVVLKGASTGGSDFAALMLFKLLPHVSLARLILWIDCAVILLSGFILKDATILFYSLISLYVASRVTDHILVRGDVAKSVYVISDKSEEIAIALMQTINRGMTGIKSKGLYRGCEGMMLLCVMKNKELPRFVECVKSLDAHAFIIISDAKEVHGEGFKKV